MGKGSKQKKTCDKWAQKGKCSKNIADEDGGGRVFEACCGQCGLSAAPSAAPSLAPSAAPSAAPSVAPSAAPSAACTNTKIGKFKVKGVKREKKCQWYAKKGKCNSKIAGKDGGGRVYVVCAKSCRTCGMR